MSKKMDVNIEKVIGQRVRQLRMQLGMSQADLGAEVGLTFQQIQKYEKGTNRISVTRMLQFAEVLQTTPNDIIGWKANNGTVANGLNATVFNAAKDFAQLPEEVQIAMRVIADLMLKMMKKKR